MLFFCPSFFAGKMTRRRKREEGQEKTRAPACPSASFPVPASTSLFCCFFIVIHAWQGAHRKALSLHQTVDCCCFCCYQSNRCMPGAFWCSERLIALESQRSLSLMLLEKTKREIIYFLAKCVCVCVCSCGVDKLIWEREKETTEKYKNSKEKLRLVVSWLPLEQSLDMHNTCAEIIATLRLSFLKSAGKLVDTLYNVSFMSPSSL